MAKRVSRGRTLTAKASRGITSFSLPFGPSCRYMVFEVRARKGPQKPAPRKK